MARLKTLLFTRKRYRFFIKDWLALEDLQSAADAVATLRFKRNLKPIQLDGLPGQRLVVIAPHPDDEMIGPGGSLLLAKARGAEILVVYLSSGSADACAIREAEAQQVAAQVGFQCHFMGWLADAIPAHAQAAQQLAAVINGFAPQRLLTTFVLDDHDDHRRANELLMVAHEEGLLSPTLDLWAYQIYTAIISNIVIDITAQSAQKRAAIALYHSQMQQRDWGHFALGMNAWNSRFIATAGQPAYVESFFNLPLGEYVQLCRRYLRDPCKVYQNPRYF
ncbi:LmbE family protein [Magnetococcus marinus MC-1]|uniref:LmbE family protein n=1 Tax=Magnetococcus marinus (strain ATCC BAA-1437 / JCM 17883 / MC-1) TaxID=156889 RepID=A0LAB9_MAGMM|nr:PIG-L family deacetylase [Magnetococcus marinus]ABK44912.1 LmbE family protein [Magnetococcus marinus MC-1]